eukprot:TRINITY_DN6078_c0_g1_i1.p1 TRINITY_DN6078_c0_g1~~TRINITY_DN6078_c0_g1_i1.p1  ORF type:complete len:663 (+),score=78.28 TRINITY_DN6078_c0_g1_i1:125-1990(+)
MNLKLGSVSTLLVVVHLFFVPISADTWWYLPEHTARSYKWGDKINLWATKLTSEKTALPYTYDHLEFCDIEGKSSQNLGQTLTGDRYRLTQYNITVLNNIECAILCVKVTNTDEFLSFISHEYRVHLELDNLAVAENYVYKLSDEADQTVSELGFPVGDKTSLFNHLNFRILYNNVSSTEVQIVGFFVVPVSINYKLSNINDTLDSICLTQQWSKSSPMILTEHSKTAAHFTYSVYWERSDIKWEERWDSYFPNSDPLYWASFSYGIVTSLFLGGLIALILIRILRSQAGTFQALDLHEQAEESGWKTLYADVFRPPQRPMLLSVIVGTSAQIIVTVFVIMLLGLAGFLSPANGGSVVTSVVVVYVVMGIFGGYTSARTYITMKGIRRRRNAIMTATFFPLTAFLIFFVMSIVFWAKKSSAGPTAGAVFAVIGLWLGINAPLVFLGNHFAYKKQQPTFPLKTNTIPRMIPKPVHWYMDANLLAFAMAFPNYGIIYNEVFFLLSAIWSNHIYYLYGFLASFMTLLVIVSAELSLILCYFQLSNENYHWWWRAVTIPFLTSAFFYVYCLFFLIKLEFTGFAAYVIYLGYSLLMALVLFLLTSGASLYFSLKFGRRIYSTVNLE